jgi:hypothetical protein
VPKEDVTRRAVVRAATVVSQVVARLNDVIPLGPERVEMTRSELVKQVHTTPSRGLMQNIIREVGEEEAFKVLGDAKRQEQGVPPVQEFDIPQELQDAAALAATPPALDQSLEDEDINA